MNAISLIFICYYPKLPYTNRRAFGLHPQSQPYASSQGVELGDIDEFAHGAIRLGGIELYCALKAYGLDNELRELTDGEFLACAYIDVAVADLTKAGDISTTACAVVTVDSTIGGGTIMYRAVFLDADDVAEVDIQEYMD